ncbi:MAG TPA: hypothetical protein VFM18_18280 [Methanosarcina sp.]|nr:hypothetical protein [Methanosarcina sp.]
MIQVNLKDYPKIHDPLIAELNKLQKGFSITSALVEEIILTGFRMKIKVIPGEPLWQVHIHEDDFAWFVLKWG